MSRIILTPKDFAILQASILISSGISLWINKNLA